MTQLEKIECIRSRCVEAHGGYTGSYRAYESGGEFGEVRLADVLLVHRRNVASRVLKGKHVDPLEELVRIVDEWDLTLDDLEVQRERTINLVYDVTS